MLGWFTTFGEKITRVSISKFQVIKILHRVEMIIDVVEFTDNQFNCFSSFKHNPSVKILPFPR